MQAFILEQQVQSIHIKLSHLIFLFTCMYGKYLKIHEFEKKEMTRQRNFELREFAPPDFFVICIQAI